MHVQSLPAARTLAGPAASTAPEARHHSPEPPTKLAHRRFWLLWTFFGNLIIPSCHSLPCGQEIHSSLQLPTKLGPVPLCPPFLLWGPHPRKAACILRGGGNQELHAQMCSPVPPFLQLVSVGDPPPCDVSVYIGKNRAVQVTVPSGPAL